MSPVVLTAALTLAIALGMRLVQARDATEAGERLTSAACCSPTGRRCNAAARAQEVVSELLTLAGVAIPPGDETKHFKLIGTTGTGKTTAIRELLGIRDRARRSGRICRS